MKEIVLPTAKKTAPKIDSPDVDDEYDDEMDEGQPFDDITDPTDIPEELQFQTTIDDEDAAEAIPVMINGIRFSLNKPDPSALAWRLGELNAAPDPMAQMMSMLGVLSTSLDKTAYLMIRERMLALKEPGKRFDPTLIGTLVKTILEKWGGGQELPELKQEPQNRQQRRAQKPRRR